MGVSIDDLPEPLRHAVLPGPALLFAVLLGLLLLAALLQRVAPHPGLRLSGGPLAGLALLLGLAATPWLRSLLWLPMLWHGATWAGLLCLLPDRGDALEPKLARHSTLGNLLPRVAAGWLRQGLLADGLCAVACALCFWGPVGTWSRAGAGFVVDVPTQSEPGSVLSLPSPQLSLQGWAGASNTVAPTTPTTLRQALQHKVFLGLPLDWVLLGLFLIALSIKLNMGLRLLRHGLGASPTGGLTHAAARQALWLLPSLSGPLLALQLWLQLRGQW